MVGLLVGLVIIFVSPVVLGNVVAVKCRLVTKRRRMNSVELYFKLWLLGIIPTLGLYLILMLITMLGNFTLFMF